MGLRIIEEGFITTIQDLGRYGYQSFGFSVNGVMDNWAMRLANIALNNHETEAVLEMSFLGPSIEFEEDMIICLSGADMSPSINEKPVTNGKPLTVNQGDTLQLRTAKTGIHCYLAVKGGLKIPEVLHSKSTDMKVELGGFQGRKLQTGDVIPIHQPMKSRPFNWYLSKKLFSYLDQNPTVIHFIEGKQYDWFTEESKQTFENELFQLSTQSDRMGYRLTGPSLHFKKQQELITEGVSFGTIQVPSSGHPIVLMADRQPTGGYPKIGQVIQADLPLFSQLRPSKAFTFKKCSLSDAYRRLLATETELNQIRSATKLRWEAIDS
ncbi:biotin-dependent carboxyltransferase family protein [Aquibacillus albus]|uniref:Antagonist of KipI n=1 Tax=Aquibacillus albus TaxID=1168171 RepID=A0ABS2MWL2_9BACI|nr:biotin-dependent carboxyltransferase family protein [Aquibacillus albus]MBM7570274.1 antagonist of KipI [Aquibacillus albus]